MAFGSSAGIPLKKRHGQHFLRQQGVVDRMIERIDLTQAHVFEIGCGDGFLTKSIIQQPINKLWVFEIDHDWAEYIKKTIRDPRLSMFEVSILDQDFTIFEADAPWILLANLPYHVSFPILYRLQEHRHLLKEGIVMVQEEVAQKIVKTSGRGYGFPSLFFQHFFEWKLLEKVPPTAFYPAPKVDSRLLYFKPRAVVPCIPNEAQFWKFIKFCFKQPRRTLKNNLMQTHYSCERLSDDLLQKRAQQLSYQELLAIWNMIQGL